MPILNRRLGVDFPRRYDVLCAARAPVLASSVVDTPASDHNLVWALLQV